MRYQPAANRNSMWEEDMINKFFSQYNQNAAYNNNMASLGNMGAVGPEEGYRYQPQQMAPQIDNKTDRIRFDNEEETMMNEIERDRELRRLRQLQPDPRNPETMPIGSFGFWNRRERV